MTRWISKLEANIVFAMNHRLSQFHATSATSLTFKVCFMQWAFTRSPEALIFFPGCARLMCSTDRWAFFLCTWELHLMRSPHNLDFWGDFATYLSWFSELFDRIALFPWYYKFSPASCVKSFGSKHVSLTYQASSLVSEGEGATVSYIPKAIFYGR